MGERDRAGLVGTDLFSYVGSQRARARERSYHGAMTEGEVRPLTHTPKACCPLLAIQAAASRADSRHATQIRQHLNPLLLAAGADTAAAASVHSGGCSVSTKPSSRSL